MKLLIGIWNMKRSQVGITFLGTLVASLLFSGCQQSVPASSATATRQAFINEVSTFAVQTVIASFPSETPTPSITPTPTETPLFTFFKTSPPQLAFTKGALPSGPGDYLLYWDEGNYTADGLNPQSVKYISLDGKISGMLLKMPPIVPNGEPGLYFEWVPSDPPSFVFYTRQYPQPNILVGESTVSAWRTDVFGNPLGNANQLNLTIGKDDACNDPAISPQAHWLVISCHSINNTGRYVVLMNLMEETVQKIDMNCGNSGSQDIYADITIWSNDDMKFLYECNWDDYLFTSLSDHAQVHKYIDGKIGSEDHWELEGYDMSKDHVGFGYQPQENGYLSVSPDWKKFAVVIRKVLNPSDKTLMTGFQVLIADLGYALSNPDCSLNDPNCNHGKVYDLPFSKSYCCRNSPYQGVPYFSLEWSHSGTEAAWTTYETSEGWIDLSSQVNHLQTGPGVLLGYSPNDQWLVLAGSDKNSGKRGLIIQNVHNANLSHFLVDEKGTEPWENVIFYGWLTIH